MEGKPKKKSQQGITLIALIITIIVLLILAGISLSLIVGENGILNKATSSAEATKKGVAIEQVSLAWSACQTDYLTSGSGSEKSIFFTKEKLNENISQGEVTQVNFEKDETGVSEVIYELDNSSYTIEITKNGEVSIVGDITNPKPEQPVKTKYSITKTIEGAGITFSNNEETVEEGATYNTNISVEENCILKTVTVTMSEAEVTTGVTIADNKKSGTINIEKVTGNIVITVKTARTLVSQVSANNYGDYVDYDVDLGLTLSLEGESTPPKTDWRIFYKDDTQNRVYLIAADYVPNTCTALNLSGAGMTRNGNYSMYWSSVPSALTTTGRQDSIFGITSSSYTLNGSNPNSKCVSKLLDTSNWSRFVNGKYADYAIGGPTIEMYTNSWNAKGYTTITPSSNSSWTGYKVNGGYSVNMSSDTEGHGNNLYYSHKSKNGIGSEECYAYWLASPSANLDVRLMCIGCGGVVDCGSYTATHVAGVRPVVSLKSECKAIKNEITGIWELSE